MNDLHCQNCGKDFTKKKHAGVTKYCSDKCRSANTYKTGIYTNKCLTCSVDYRTMKKDKKFCSMVCYKSSDQFKLMVQEKKDRAKIEFQCHHCAEKIVRKNGQRSATSGKRHFCNTVCWRKWYAERFDRFVANPEEPTLPQCYDEFLTKELLPCLFPGCGWVGRHLGQHVNIEHGVTADEFKEMAGFCIGTGLVCPELSIELSDRVDNDVGAFAEISGGRPRGSKARLEEKEHYFKARSIR